MKKEVKIELNNKEYIFPLGLGFIGECLDNLDLSITSLCEKMDDNAFKWSTAVMYESLKYQYGDDLDFSKKEMLEYLDNDDNGIAKIGNFNRAFVQTLTPKLPQEPTNKKKVIPKKKR